MVGASGGGGVRCPFQWERRLDQSAVNAVRMLQEQLGNRLIMSLVLYGGEDVLALGPQLVAVPYDVFFGGRLAIGSKERR